MLGYSPAVLYHRGRLNVPQVDITTEGISLDQSDSKRF
jgi:hypothetical protein